jgi:hypothetical protein
MPNLVLNWTARGRLAWFIRPLYSQESAVYAPLITFGFLLAALVAYWISFSPALPGAVWVAGALFAAGLFCELVFWLRPFRHENL